ncbi:MAG: hypothetical protein EBR26_05475, partial [Microbacteriaceae bacterium]|nr:hypothetical protein [Microbacteriaceae bacterium]
VQSGENGLVVALPLNSDTQPAGLHSMFWDNRTGHSLVRALPITEQDSRRFEVVRDFGKPVKVGDLVWLSGWNGDQPEDFGLHGVSEVALPNGTSAYYSAGSKVWVIHVHGRTATRSEPLRNFTTISTLGFSQISISHETDEPPLGLGKRRSYLGAKEWLQVEAAVNYAISHGATRVVLFGFSLGAMFIGEFLRKSPLADIVESVVFDSPLIDFESTLNLQSLRAGFDATLGSYGLQLMQDSRIFRLFGLHQPEIPTLLRDVGKPGLVFYSAQDGYVSMQRIPMLAELNPDFRFVSFANGKHCRLYNQEPERYTKELLSFLEDYRT